MSKSVARAISQDFQSAAQLKVKSTVWKRPEISKTCRLLPDFLRQKAGEWPRPESETVLRPDPCPFYRFHLPGFAWDDSNRRLPLHCTNWQRHLPLDRENLICGKIQLLILLTIASFLSVALTSTPHLSRASKSLTSHFLHLFSFNRWKAPAAPKIRNSRKRKSSLKCFSLNPRCCPDGAGVEFFLERRVESVQTATAKFSVLLDKKGEWNIMYIVGGVRSLVVGWD